MLAGALHGRFASLDYSKKWVNGRSNRQGASELTGERKGTNRVGRVHRVLLRAVLHVPERQVVVIVPLRPMRLHFAAFRPVRSARKRAAQVAGAKGCAQRPNMHRSPLR